MMVMVVVAIQCLSQGKYLVNVVVAFMVLLCIRVPMNVRIQPLKSEKYHDGWVVAHHEEEAMKFAVESFGKTVRVPHNAQLRTVV